MRNVIKAVTFALALGTAASALATKPAAPDKTSAAAVAPDRKKLQDHLKNHQTDPATRAELLAACKDLMDFSAAEKQWFNDRLPDGTYKSPDEVMKAVFKK